MKKLVFAVLSLVSSYSFAGGDGNTPPELPPRDGAEFEQDLTDPEAGKPAKPAKAAGKSECGPKKDYIEGKCICEKTPCKPKVVEKKVYVDRPVIKEVIKERPVIKEVIREKPVIKERTVIKDRPVEKIVERTVDRVVTQYVERHHQLLFGYGRGPDGVAPVLYERRDNRKEYKFYQEYGNVWGIMYNYSFTAFETVPMSAGLLYISNDTKMGFAGFRF
jgi:hypothetical protein